MNEEVDVNIRSKSEKLLQAPLQPITTTENCNELENGENPTWSKHLNWTERIKLYLGNSFRAFKSNMLLSEDDANCQYTSGKVIHAKDNSNLIPELPKSTRSSTKFIKNISKISSNIDNKMLAIEISPSTSKRYIMNNELRTSNIDVNLQIENNVLSDSDDDKDSIVIAYLKDKDSITSIGNSLTPLTNKKPSVLEKVPKMETILEGEQFAAFQSPSLTSNIEKTQNSLSESSLDVYIPSFPGSPRSLNIGSAQSLLSIESHDPFFIEAVEFLHEDKEFLIAAETGNHKILDILIRRGTNIQQMDHLGRNALHLAVCSNSEAAVMLFLKTGIKTNVKDNLGMTALSLCLMRRPSYKIANRLFDHGAQIMPRSSPVDTGLFLQFVMMCTPTREDGEILKLLVEKGAIVNDPEAPGGRQTLHFAAMSNNCKLINILVDLGANLTVTNHRNETPKDVAEIFKCKEAYELLLALEQEEDETVSTSVTNESIK